MKKEDINKNIILFKTEAITCMAEMFEYAENTVRVNAKDFFSLFNNTNISDAFFTLDIKYILGKSSIEIVKEVLDLNHIKYKTLIHRKRFVNDAYWVGLIVSSYCFAKNISFKKFEQVFDINDIKRMYNPLHEAPHNKAIEAIDCILSSKKTNLSIVRENAGYSQNELSAISGVSLRSIQMYEQRNKDINKASFSTIKSLATTLHVSLDDLYECSNFGNDNLITMY